MPPRDSFGRMRSVWHRGVRATGPLISACSRKALAAACLLFGCGCMARADPPSQVTPVPVAVRRAASLSEFYQKYIDANGLSVLASERVSDQALQECARIVNAMLEAREDIRHALVRSHVRVVVMASTEQTTDIPEYRDMQPRGYWNRRARGLGATPLRPVSSCAEENLLHEPGDRYPNESILIHEFAHTIHVMGLRSINPGFDSRLRQAYEHAMAGGLWAHTYAASNYAEYWAEAVQSYYDANDANNEQHNDINTRDKLRDYDPEVFALVDSVFGGSRWRYTPYSRQAGGVAPGSSRRVHVRIKNSSGLPVSIYWVDGGTPRLYRTLAPGGSYDQVTYAGHEWQARFEGNKPGADFVAPAADGDWELQ
jgi:hypothetical protein